MAFFGPKAWVNPFGKMRISRLLKILLFIAQKGFFFFCKVLKHYFESYFDQIEIKKLLVFFYQKHGLTPLEKCEFLDFEKVCLFYTQKEKE